MFRLLKLEWLKYRKHKAFRVLLGLYFIILPALVLLPKSFDRLPDELADMSTFYMFPNIYGFAGYIGSWLLFFIMGFLGVLMITPEYDFKTLRQNIITGLSRNQFLTGKFAFIVFICLVVTVYFALVALLFGFTHTDAIYASKVMEGGNYFIRYFLQGFAYMVFGFLLGAIFKRTGLCLFLFFAYSMFIEPILRWVIHKKVLDNESMNYYPFNAFEDLVPIPFSDQIESMTREAGFEIILDPTMALILSLAYISIFILIIRRKITTADL